MTKTTKTKTDRIYNALVERGQELTAAQIKTRFGVSNPHDAVYQLRRKGYAITLNEYKANNGKVTRKYSYTATTTKTKAKSKTS